MILGVIKMLENLINKIQENERKLYIGFCELRKKLKEENVTLETFAYNQELFNTFSYMSGNIDFLLENMLLYLTNLKSKEIPCELENTKDKIAISLNIGKL